MSRSRPFKAQIGFLCVQLAAQPAQPLASISKLVSAQSECQLVTNPIDLQSVQSSRGGVSVTCIVKPLTAQQAAFLANVAAKAHHQETAAR